jgi:hypothetical protein
LITVHFRRPRFAAFKSTSPAPFDGGGAFAFGGIGNRYLLCREIDNEFRQLVGIAWPLALAYRHAIIMA